jgi:hypothetical protein
VEQGSLRSILTVDVDDDGDRDALAVTTGKDGLARIAFSRRAAEKFEAPAQLADLLPSRESCEVEGASLRTVAPRLAIAHVTRSCEDGPEQALAILSVEDPPRVRERVTLLPPEGRAQGAVALGLQTEDRDADGYADVILSVSVQTEEGVTAEIDLPWLDRPGGLARDRKEPEATFDELAAQARKALDDAPSEAQAKARQVLALHGVLCREGGRPRLRFGDSEGLSCGRSAAAGTALAVLSAARAKEGALFDSLALARRPEERGFALSKADRKLIDEAWAQAAEPAASARKLTEHAPATRPDVRLPSLAFRSDEELLLRGEDAKRMPLDAGAEPEMLPGASGTVVMTDPTGRFAVTDIHRTCQGYALHIVANADVVSGVVTGPAVSTPLLEPLPPPPGSRCEPPAQGKLPDTLRDDDGGFRVLGWAPQGIVAARADEIRVVPLTASAEPAGDATVLAEGTPLPAPLPPGSATPDGQAYALATPYGLVVRRLGANGTTRLLRPKGWASQDGAVRESDVAIAPDATRVAYMRGHTVWVVEAAGASD